MLRCRPISVSGKCDEKVIEHSNDPILDNRIGGSDGDDFFGIGGSSNHYCIFTDRLFAESGADLAFTVDDADLYQVFAEQYFDKLRVLPFVEVSLISMDRAEYDYLSIQNVLYDNDYDTSDFLEPVTVPTNVMGGTGFVGVYNPSSIIIRLPEKVYGGMVVGECPRQEDIEVNVCKRKQLTNTRASGSDEALKLTPPKILSLEQALDFIDTDELLEITPEHLRIRKKILDPKLRLRAGRAAAQQG